MTIPSAPHAAPSPAPASGHLDRLVARTAAGDRAAFRMLYAGLAVHVWCVVVSRLRREVAVAVVQATFVEVRLRAHSYDGEAGDPREWVTAIAVRRADERRRGAGGRHHRPEEITADYDALVQSQLAEQLGDGPSTIRITAGAFLRVGDLDQALPAIADAWARAQHTVNNTWAGH
jgi:DNA-directed RNA polymerase specialized sigma24 family protein